MTWTPVDAESWTLTIGGVQVESFFELEDLESEHEWQLSRPKGTTGTRAKYLGRKDRTFTIKATLTTTAEYSNWMNVVSTALKPPDKGKPYVIAIEHPLLAEHYGITHCRLVREFAPQRERQGLKRWIARLQLQESAPPKSTAVSVKGSRKPPKDPALNSPRAAEIEKKREELAQLDAEDQQYHEKAYVADSDTLAEGSIPAQ